jgi:hypothetical protein
MTRHGFRRLIILQWMLGLASCVVTFATVPYLPPELRSYWESQARAELTNGDWVLFGVSMLLLVGSIIVYLGLYRFKPWAKSLLLPINVVALLLSPLYGPAVMTGWASALSYASTLVGGGVIFLVYLSPIRQMFARGGDA